MAHVRLEFTAEPTYTVKALDESTWAAFAPLVERNNGIFGGCWSSVVVPRRHHWPGSCSWPGFAHRAGALPRRGA